MVRVWLTFKAGAPEAPTTTTNHRSELLVLVPQRTQIRSTSTIQIRIRRGRQRRRRGRQGEDDATSARREQEKGCSKPCRVPVPATGGEPPETEREKRDLERRGEQSESELGFGGARGRCGLYSRRPQRLDRTDEGHGAVAIQRLERKTPCR